MMRNQDVMARSVWLLVVSSVQGVVGGFVTRRYVMNNPYDKLKEIVRDQPAIIDVLEEIGILDYDIVKEVIDSEEF